METEKRDKHLFLILLGHTYIYILTCDHKGPSAHNLVINSVNSIVEVK